MVTEEAIYSHINKYTKPSDQKALEYLVPTLILYVGGFYLPLWTFIFDDLLLFYSKLVLLKIDYPIIMLLDSIHYSS